VFSRQMRSEIMSHVRSTDYDSCCFFGKYAGYSSGFERLVRDLRLSNEEGNLFVEPRVE